MANQLNVAETQVILMLYERGWSCRRIARELGIHRETVGKYVRELGTGDESKPATPAPGIAPPGSQPQSAGSKPAKAPTGSCQIASISGDASVAPGSSSAPGSPAGVGPPRTLSDCRPYHDQIVAKLEQGLSAQRIYQDLAADHGEDAPSYYSIRRYA